MHKASSSRPPESLNLDLLNLVLHNAYLCHAMMFLSFELLLELLFELLQMTPGRSSTQYKKECYIFTSWLLGGFDFFFRMGLEPNIVSITEPVKSEVIPKCPHAPKSPHAPKKSILDFSFYVRNGKLNSPGEN